MKCLYCGKNLEKYQTKYCNSKCQQKYQQDTYIKKWQSGEEDGMVGQYGTSKRIRTYLFEKHNNKCELCGWGEINPYTKTIPLEIHHKDGNYQNNQEENLELLCPNCHSLTENFKGANKNNGRGEERNKYKSRKNYCVDCGVEINSTSTRCRKCESKNRKQNLPISREELKNLIRTIPFTKIGEKFKVSDNTIRKWCDKYNLPRKSTEIKKYSDKEWENI